MSDLTLAQRCLELSSLHGMEAEKLNTLLRAVGRLLAEVAPAASEPQLLRYVLAPAGLKPETADSSANAERVYRADEVEALMQWRSDRPPPITLDEIRKRLNFAIPDYAWTDVSAFRHDGPVRPRSRLSCTVYLNKAAFCCEAIEVKRGFQEEYVATEPRWEEFLNTCDELFQTYGNVCPLRNRDREYAVFLALS